MAVAEGAKVPERDSCHLQIPKGPNPLYRGWKDVFMTISFTMKKLLLYDREEDMEFGSAFSTFEFSQVYAVRTLRPCEHEAVRVKQGDSKKILLLWYIEQEASNGSSNKQEVTDRTTVQVQGHQFSETSYRTPSNCDVCNRGLPWSLLGKGKGSYECKRCRFKCHKEHADKGESAMQPCVRGERDVKRLLLLIKDDEVRERWLNQLSRITLVREESKPPSPPSSPSRAQHNSSQYAATFGASSTANTQSRPPLPVEYLRSAEYHGDSRSQ